LNQCNQPFRVESLNVGSRSIWDIATGPLKDYIKSCNQLGASLRYSTQIRPISYLKANAAEVLQVLEEQRKPMIITQNGEAKAVIQDVTSYEETQETLALLKILALGSQQVERGEITPISEVAGRLRGKATSP
jgi:prevent-host-death family protein